MALSHSNYNKLLKHETANLFDSFEKCTIISIDSIMFIHQQVFFFDQ